MRLVLLALLTIGLLPFGFVRSLHAKTVAPPAYSDNRDDAAALVRSLYNAINRHEYARAYSYFNPPLEVSFKRYVAGFADTGSVTVYTGTITYEGAAGSTYQQVPIAIRATAKDGSSKVFSGCYTIRGSNDQTSDAPFNGLKIEKALLKSSQEDILSAAVPETCEGAPPLEAWPAGDEAQRIETQFISENRNSCNRMFDNPEYGGGSKPQVHDLTYTFQGDTTEQKARLYVFECYAAAYNFTQVYYYTSAEGPPKRLTFAEPKLTITYQDEDSAKLKSMTPAGIVTNDFLTNSSYDPATQSLSAVPKWRGAGDAYSVGKWVFTGGAFVLTDYDVDPTYDGETETISVFKNGVFVP
jgi:Protein of unknown function (DUF1176)